jgi:hypothetical protein
MCHNIRLRAQLTLLLMTGTMPMLAALGDDEVPGIDRTPQDCISTNRIRDTSIVDDRTIVFELRGGTYYTNILDRNCPGLERHKRFMHETSGGRLCDIDTITVLEQWAGRVTPGFTCQLGQFHPITEIEANDLVLGPDAARAISNDIEVKEVDLPPGESEAVPAEEADAAAPAN